jgi:FkbM family methyltransferase
MLNAMLPFDTRVATGEFGAFEGPASDGVVLARYAAEGSWSRQLVALLGAQLTRGGTLLDVGAHVGLISIAVAARSRAHCIAFEPAPDNAACLARNVVRHGLTSRIELHALALSDQPGTLRLGLSPDNGGDHHALVAGAALAPGWREQAIPCARLDDLLEGRTLERPLLLKLDTQGSEVRVLRGAQRVLEQVDAIVLEYWPAGLARLGDRASMLEPLLARFEWAAVLAQDDRALSLAPRSDVLRSLAWIAEDGSDQGFFDLLLTTSREPFTDSANETPALR